MFFPQMIHVGKSQPGQATEYEHVADAFQPFVGHLFSDQRIEFRFGQVVFRFVVLLFQFVVLKRILFDPFVADGVED